MKNIQKNTIPKHRKLHLIFRFLQGSKLYFAAAVAASLVSTILNALTPQIFRFSIDEVLSGSSGTMGTSGTIGSSGTSGSYLSSHLWVLALMIVAVAIASVFLPTSAVPIQPGQGRILLKICGIHYLSMCRSFP